MEKQKITGSEALLKALIAEGVDTIFGYPGGQAIPIYDSLYDYRDQLRHVLVRHEQGATHAAQGYARVSGKVGVTLVTSGPGATNLVTGIATAFMDSIPMVAITCNVGVSLLGRDSFQEIDITGVTMPITKYNFIVKDIEKNKAIIKEIIGNNRDVADIGEINEATFTSSERDAFRAASEAIEADYAILIDYAKMVGLEDIDKYLTKSSKAENEVN